MARNKSSQFPKGSKFQPSQSSKSPTSPSISSSSSSIPLESSQSPRALTPPLRPAVQPEQMSLEAHQHIQTYLDKRKTLDKDEVTAILRLSQHLRVFGLLSAVGYLNHGKDSGEVAKRTKPVWGALLKSLVSEGDSDTDSVDLMKTVKEMAEQKPAVYMATWRKSLILSKHWNFWAKAYQEE